MPKTSSSRDIFDQYASVSREAFYTSQQMAQSVWATSALPLQVSFIWLSFFDHRTSPERWIARNGTPGLEVSAEMPVEASAGKIRRARRRAAGNAGEATAQKDAVSPVDAVNSWISRYAGSEPKPS